MDNTKVKAVNSDDMMDLLKSLNVYDDVINGLYKCSFCCKDISINNIGAIFPSENKVAFSCDDENCHIKLITLQKGEKLNDCSSC